MRAPTGFTRWMLAPGFTGFSHIAHAFWCVGGLLHYLGFPLAAAWFGYCCWSRDAGRSLTAGFALLTCGLLSGTTLVVASKMMTTESILSRQAGGDLEF